MRMAENGPKTAKPKRGLYTPKAKQARIIAGNLAGKSQRQLAREEALDRGTVGRILAQPEVRGIREEYRQQVLLGLVPAAFDAIRSKLLTKAGKLRKQFDWRLPIEILKGAQILVSKVQEEVKQTDEFEGRSDAELDYALTHGGRWPEEDQVEVGKDSSGEVLPGTGQKVQ